MLCVLTCHWCSSFLPIKENSTLHCISFAEGLDLGLYFKQMSMNDMPNQSRHFVPSLFLLDLNDIKIMIFFIKNKKSPHSSN